MFLLTYTAAPLAFVCLGFAVFLLLKKREDRLARYLAYHVLGVAAWVGSNAAADISKRPATLIFWSGMAFIGVSFFVSFYLCFIDAFIGKRRPSVVRLVAYFLPTAVFTVGAFTKLSVKETLFPEGLPAQIVPGVFYNYVPFFMLGSLVYGVARLAWHGRTGADAQKRLQIFYMEIGYALMISGSVFFDIVLPFFGEYRYYTAGPQFSIFLVACSGYAILKHRMIDIKVVVQRSVVYSLLLGAVTAFYLAALYGAAFFTGERVAFPYFLASLTTAIAGIVGVPPLKRLFQRATDRLFFKDRCSYAAAVDRLSQEINRHLDLDQLTAGVSAALRDLFKTEDVRIVLGDLREEPPPDGVAMAARLKEKTVAVMLLGAKRSGDPYFEDDIGLLKSFSYQFAVAVEKARLYRQAKDHSERLEEKVRERTAEIKTLQEEQARMMFDISHSLLTPLTIIKGQLGNLRTASFDEGQIAAFEKSIDTISEFIRRLLKLSRLNGAESAKRETVDVSGLLGGIVSYFEVLAESRNVAIEASIEKNLRVLGDGGQLEELALNILSNAVKYIDHDRRIAIRLSDDEENAYLTVRDTGIGIAADEIPRIFRRFYRSSGGSRAEGSGLGLAICKKIAELHGGTIAIASELGVGTTVTVTLPKLREAVRVLQPVP